MRLARKLTLLLVAVVLTQLIENAAVAIILTNHDGLTDARMFGQRLLDFTGLEGPTTQLGWAGECLLDSHLLIETEADQQGQRIGGEQPI